jgi:hypothetical protein
MRQPSSLCRLVVLVSLAAALAACGSDTPSSPSPGPCTFTLSTASLSLGAGSSAGSVNVSAASHCTWTAAANQSWLSITSGTTGTGNGVVSVNATANSSEAVRTGAVTIAGQAVSVVQEGLSACTLEIAPTSASFGDGRESGRFSVTAPAHCAWSATSGTPWVSVTAGSTGTGNGTVDYTIDSNGDGRPRTGTIAVGNRTFTVEQSGETTPPAACQYSVSPIQFSPCMSTPGALTATVTTQPGCTWTAVSPAPWINLTAGQSGSGSGVVSFTVADNWDAPRQGVVMVRWPTASAGQDLQVSQAGCTYAVSTSTISVAAAGGNNEFNVIQASDPMTCGGPLQNACVWTAQADVPWITFTTTMPQAGDNPVRFTVAPNSSTSPRTGRITVRDKVVQITQSGQ